MSASAPQTPRAERRALGLLAAGAALGLALAAAGLLRGAAPDALPDGSVASVNGTPIRTEEFARALAALARDRRAPLGDAERRQVLDRLIDEELLVQRALALGLARHDRQVRSELVGAVIGSVVTDAGQELPTPADLDAFFAENRDYFQQPGRLRVHELRLRPQDGESREALEARARAAAERLRAGEPLAALAQDAGDATPGAPPLPDALLPPGTLGEYLGPTALRAALALQPGEVSEPLVTAGGVRVLQVVEREPDRVPALEEIAETVAGEWRRRAGERALRRYLDDLREDAALRVAETLP